MPMFASTTTTGYSDPLKALSIKALEQRMKDMQAQQAAQQPDMALMGTIPGGIGHVLGQVGDSFKTMRTEAAAAEGRNELSAVIAQGPQGANGEWSPQQLSIMARRAPDLMEKFYQQQHERGNLNITEGGLNKRATEQNQTTLQNTELANTGRETTAAGDRASREKVTGIEQAGANARTITQTDAQLAIERLRDTGADRRLGSTQSHEASQLRLKSELDAAAKELQYAQENKIQDRTIAAQEKIAKLQSELRQGEEQQKAGFRSAEQDKQFTQDDKMKGLDREAVAANLKLTLANQTRNSEMRIEAEKELADINNRATARREEIKAENAGRLQTQAETATSRDVATRVASAEAIAKADAEAKAKLAAADPKRAEAKRVAEVGYRAGLTHIQNMEEAAKILERPGGIYTGASQHIAPIMGGAPILDNFVDKEKAQDTARFNSLVGVDAVKDMAETLNGPTTNFEMQKFEKFKNDPNISDAQRAEQLRKVVIAARVDLEARREEAQAVGGNTARVDAGMAATGGGGPAAAAPAAAPASDPLSRAQAALDKGAPYEAVAKLLQEKGGDPSLLKRKAP